MKKVNAILPEELYSQYKTKIKYARKISQMHDFLENNEVEGKTKAELAQLYINLMKEVHAMFVIEYPKITDLHPIDNDDNIKDKEEKTSE